MLNANFHQSNKEKTDMIVFGNEEKRIKVFAQLQSRAMKAKSQVRNLHVLIDSYLNHPSHSYYKILF